MIKILHSADWHLDSPLRCFTARQREALRRRMLDIPGRIADLAIREGCDLMLLSGDIFDGPYTQDSVNAVCRALERVGIPVFLSPGNHDPYGPNSPWFRETWPENLHIFTRQTISSYVIPDLSCRVYGAAFQGPDCPGLLDGFRAGGDERYALLVLHSDPTAPNSPYCPVTAAQVRESGLDYAALGHIHAAGRLGSNCAWPGCPMGRGWDETGPKGALLVELEETASIRFLPLDMPRFYDLSTEAGEDPVGAVKQLLPQDSSADFYRIRLTGEVRPGVMERLQGQLSGYPNLTLLDETIPEGNIWETVQEDSLEGIFFRVLHDAAQDQDPETVEALELAAKISRQILQGREVELP